MATDKITIVIDAQAEKAIQDFIRLNREQKKQEGLLDGLKGKWAAFGAAIGSAAGALKLTEFTKSFAQFRQASEATSKQFGKSADEIIKKLREVSGGTIANNDLIVAANKALALNVTKDIGQIAKLLEIARLRGRALGVDTTQAFEDIVTGIGRNSPLILDNLGIITKGWAEQAAAAGVAYDTNFILNKVLEDGNKTLAKTGPLTVSAAERFQQLSAGFQNAKLSLGQALLPLFERLIPILSNLIDGFLKLPDSLKATGAAAAILVPLLISLSAILSPLALTIAAIAASTVLLTGAIIEATKATEERYVQAKFEKQINKDRIKFLNEEIKKLGEEKLSIIANGGSKKRLNEIEKELNFNKDQVVKTTELLNEATQRELKFGIALGKTTDENTASYIEYAKAKNKAASTPSPLGGAPKSPDVPDADVAGIDLDIDALNKSNEDYKLAAQERKDFTVDLANQMKNDLFTIYSDIANRRIDELDREQDAIRDKIENGVITEEEGQKQLDALRKKEKAERVKLARAQKAQTLSEIVMKTANGIMGIWEHWGKFPPVAASLTGLLSGIGIAQSALVASQPLPQFAQGTNDAPGGLSLVGEQGAELVNIPENGQVITNDILRTMADKGSSGNVYNIKIETNDPQQFVKRMQSQYGLRFFGAS